MTVVYGKHPVEEVLMLAPKEIVRLVADYAERFRDFSIPEEIAVEVDPEELERITSGGNHQGIAAELAPFHYTPLSEVLTSIGGHPTAQIVVLDQVQDPHNLGAILRSAAALDADAVVIAKDRAAGVTDTVIRTSAGLAYRVPVCMVTNIARTLDSLREEGFWVVGTFMDGDTDLWDVDFEMKTALVMGGEIGMRRLVREKCDFRARIPMAPGAESLNVSVAASVALYEIARQLDEG